MANTSSTGGVLLPADAPAPAEDAELDAIVQRLVSSITGLPSALVRPRWQPVVPQQPEPSVNWCAVGVMDQASDGAPSITHNSAGNGSDTLITHEEINVLASFYGPRAQFYAEMLRDGLGMPQNLEQLAEQDMAFVEAGRVVSMPALVNQQWIKRRDMPVRLRRKITRVYAIQNIDLADIHLFDDTHIDRLIEVPPAP
jgi:hypothetical protein